MQPPLESKGQKKPVTDVPADVLSQSHVTQDGMLAYDIHNQCVPVCGRLQFLRSDLESKQLDFPKLDKDFEDLTRVISGIKPYAEYLFQRILPKADSELRAALSDQSVEVSLEVFLGKHNEGRIAELNRSFDRLLKTVDVSSGKPIDPHAVVLALRAVYECLDIFLAPDAMHYTKAFDEIGFDFTKQRPKLEAYWESKGIARHLWPAAETHIDLTSSELPRME